MHTLLRFTAGLAFVLATVSAGSAQEMQWVRNTNPANPIPTCLQLCQDSSGTPYAVRGGNYAQDPYYVCVAEMDGLRPGYQVTNHSSGPMCNVGHDSREKGAPVAACLCSNKKVAAE